MYKVAVCLHGLVGNAIGKSQEHNKNSREVLELAYKHWHKHIIRPQTKRDCQVDFFIHTWSEDLEEDIVRLFNPRAIKTQSQPSFDIPDYVKGEESRKHAHYCRWYSNKESVDLKSAHENENGFIYDCVMCARFDIAWQKKIIFKKHDQKQFWVAKWSTDKPGGKGQKPPTKKCKDFWWFSSSKNINKFAKLYYRLDEYNKPKNASINKKLGVSNHFLMSYHAKKLKLNFGLVLESRDNFANSDFPLIRYHYFDAKV